LKSIVYDCFIHCTIHRQKKLYLWNVSSSVSRSFSVSLQIEWGFSSTYCYRRFRSFNFKRQQRYWRSFWCFKFYFENKEFS
jgi:hypothetical protein